MIGRSDWPRSLVVATREFVRPVPEAVRGGIGCKSVPSRLYRRYLPRSGPFFGLQSQQLSRKQSRLAAVCAAGYYLCESTGRRGEREGESRATAALIVEADARTLLVSGAAAAPRILWQSKLPVIHTPPPPTLSSGNPLPVRTRPSLGLTLKRLSPLPGSSPNWRGVD